MIKINLFTAPLLYYSLLLFSLLSRPITLVAQELQIVIPQQIDKRTDQSNVLADEKFYTYPFSGDIVDLKAFKKINPNIDIPDSLAIRLPNLTDIAEKSLLIGYLKNASDGKNYLVVIIVGNYNTNEATFFLDTNFDQDYRNDDPPLVLIGGATPTKVLLAPPKASKFALILGLPKRLSLIEKKLRDLDNLNKKFKTKISKSFTIGFSVGIGTGKSNYEYTNTDTGYPTWYNVRFSEKAFRTMINYDFARFKLGVDATFINHYYFTSYYNVRLSEPRGIRTGVLTERNIDQHALNRIQIGLTAAYKINLSRYAEIQPMITYGKNIYLADAYFSDTRPQKEKFYSLSPDSYLEYGVQLEFTIGYKKAFVFNIINNQVFWQLNQFSEALNIEDFNTQHRSLRLHLGYRFAISN